MNVIPDRHRKKQRKPNSKTTETVSGAVEPVETNSKQFSKRELVSNWDKYADKAPNTDSAPQDTSDFEALLANPASVGGHFLFNSEKSWESKDDWYNRDDYFQLNLMELSKSLATIPFYERQSYPKEIFSSEEIQDMNRQAKYQLFKWQSANSNHTLSSGSATMDSKCEMCKTIQPQDDDDDLDELLKTGMTGQQNKHTTEYASKVIQPSSVGSVAIQASETLCSAESTDDIQKWLDDVLVLS